MSVRPSVCFVEHILRLLKTETRQRATPTRGQRVHRHERCFRPFGFKNRYIHTFHNLIVFYSKNIPAKLDVHTQCLFQASFFLGGGYFRPPKQHTILPPPTAAKLCAITSSYRLAPAPVTKCHISRRSECSKSFSAGAMNYKCITETFF